MTAKPAKKVRCNWWKECEQKKCPFRKPHIIVKWMCLTFYCCRGKRDARCIPVKPRKPSPAKPTISMDMRKAHEEEWYGLRSADEKLDFVWSMLIKLAKKLEKVK